MFGVIYNFPYYGKSYGTLYVCGTLLIFLTSYDILTRIVNIHFGLTVRLQGISYIHIFRYVVIASFLKNFERLHIYNTIMLRDCSASAKLV